MQSAAATVIERLLLTAWVGSQWAIGYIAAPVLFAVLESRRTAGELAGQMFTVVHILGLVAGGILLVIVVKGASTIGRKWRVWSLVAMLLVAAISLFGLQPVMVELKAQGLAAGSPQAARFGMLHGVSSILYLISSVLGALLVVLGLRPRTKGEGN